MELKSRTTKYFIEIKVDEIETTLFSDDEKGIRKMIENLLSIASDLASYTNNELTDYIES